MRRDFKLIVIANGVFVFLYVAYNWAEYLALNSFASVQVAIRANFPWLIQISGINRDGDPLVFLDSNFTLFVFLLAIFVNLYFIFRLQSSKETKQTPS